MTDIIDRIAALHRQLVERPEYRQFVTAKIHEDAVEGHLDFDTARAVFMLQREALAQGDTAVGAPIMGATIAEILERIIDRPVDLPERERDAAEMRDIVREGLGLPPWTEADRKRRLS